MICITVTPTSRTLAKADLLNAARHGDIVELCLDHFVKEPDVADLIKSIDKPLIVSCRRPEEGGHWKGTEEERLMLLRQAIVAGPDYVELDLDIAPQVPRFGKTRRVISFTRLDQPETDVNHVFYEAANAKADVVKFTWPTPTIDDAWPLLAAVSQKRILPVVGMGLGPAELTFSLLGRKYGSPWIYAALEHGMEAHEGQATVFELDEDYHCRAIGPKTVFVAIAGFGPAQTMTTRILNNAFEQSGMNVRCLPFVPDDLSRLKKMLDVLKIKAVLVSGGLGRAILPLADEIDKHDQHSQYIDLLLKRDDHWHGYNTLWRSGLKAIETAMGKSDANPRPLDRQNVLILGNGGIAESMVYAVRRRDGLVSVVGPNDKEAQRVASENECRFVPYQSLYDTLAEVVILADPKLRAGHSHGAVNPSFLNPGQTVIDVSDPPRETDLFSEARLRGCRLIEPTAVYRDQIAAQFKALTGREIPADAVDSALSEG
ncbi:Shikimate dehydrogenase [Maioricimonas rarisocia]|uniref:Shikimate dehydrogenase n=1 Tax=Maioricimonas rarisocia TaxID=2528026 RepID=A0A517Z1C0_9PLAN|nr:type I 3-dehydroquinate dehydratase [Maioricimonas rarisocia]QDU36219.1 Shikimate dehydrogenase [Maioricimonas rarisocia]